MFYSSDETLCTYQHNHMTLEWVGILKGVYTQKHKYSLHYLNTQQVVHRSLGYIHNDLNRDDTHTYTQTNTKNNM